MQSNNFRLIGVGLFVFGLFSLLIIQFFKIQILEGEKWTKAGRRQHELVMVEPARRGLFYSNTAVKKGHPEELQPFVVDVPKFHLFADPSAITPAVRAAFALRISEILQLSEKEKTKVALQLEKKSRSRKIKMGLTQEEKNRVQGWWDAFAKKHKLARNAIYFVQDYKRSYPFGQLLGQVLQTVHEESDARAHRTIPTGGMELYFDSLLKGSEGKRLLLRSPRQPLDTETILAEPENGADVFLTINHYIQAIAEEEIARAVQNAGAKRGWAIMMHPRTGEIYALAQYPSFDPSEYARLYEKMASEIEVRAITDPYEPGSTMKPITLALCLKANAELKKQGKSPLFSPEEKIDTLNGRFPGRSKPISDLHPHHFLNMDLALQKSSNIYMARMVQRVTQTLGEDWYRSALQNIFGFGKKIELELPGESIGLLPTPGKKHPNGTLEWSTATPFSIAFGHNILVTSMQMVKSYAILANGGFDVRPTLVRKIVKTHGDGRKELVLDYTRADRIEAMPRLLEPEIVERVIRSMKFATKPGGTAVKGDVPGYTEVGKTGTTEKIVGGVYSKKDHIATFIGFTPAKNAQFVLMIAIDDPEFKYIPGVGKNQHGGNCAAPAFREISVRTLQYLGVQPDDPSMTDWLKETHELKELYRAWNET